MTSSCVVGITEVCELDTVLLVLKCFLLDCCELSSFFVIAFDCAVLR